VFYQAVVKTFAQRPLKAQLAGDFSHEKMCHHLKKL